MSKDFIPNTEKLLLKITVTIWQSLAEKDPVNVNYDIAYKYLRKVIQQYITISRRNCHKNG